MIHAFQLTDKEFAALLSYANRMERTPEDLFTYWLNERLEREEALRSLDESKQAKKSRNTNLSHALPANPSTPVPEEEEMMHEFTLTDEQFVAFAQHADICGENLQESFESWVDMKLTFWEVKKGITYEEQRWQKRREKGPPNPSRTDPKGSAAPSTPEKEEKIKSHTLWLTHSLYTQLEECCLEHDGIFPQAVFQDWFQGMVYYGYGKRKEFQEEKYPLRQAVDSSSGKRYSSGSLNQDTTANMG